MNTETPIQDKPKASVSFSLPKGCKVNGAMPMTVDKMTSVTINGKVISISDDKWGRNFSIEPHSIKTHSVGKSTMGDEMRKMRNKHKYKAGSEDEDDG